MLRYRVPAELAKKEMKEKAKKEATEKSPTALPLTEKAAAPAPASALEVLAELSDRIVNAVKAPFTRGTPRMTDEQRRFAKGVVQKICKRDLAVAWNTWRAHAEETAYILNRINRAVRLLRDPSFTRAWGKWAEFYQERLHAKDLLRKTLSRFANGALVTAMGTWHAFAQAEAHFDRQERLLLLSIARMRRPWLVVALRAWQDECGIAPSAHPCHALARCLRLKS